VRYKATDSSDFGGAKTKLASQILHSYILNSAFLNDPSANVPPTHHAKIIEGRNYSVYIVGQEKNVQESADWMPYSLYELKPGTNIGVTSNCDPNGTQNYIATGIHYSLFVMQADFFLYNSFIFSNYQWDELPRLWESSRVGTERSCTQRPLIIYSRRYGFQ